MSQKIRNISKVNPDKGHFYLEEGTRIYWYKDINKITWRREGSNKTFESLEETVNDIQSRVDVLVHILRNITDEELKEKKATHEIMLVWDRLCNIGTEYENDKSVEIKDHEVASLASLIQKAFGQDLADFWNQKTPVAKLYDSGDCRQAIVAMIKQWRSANGRDPK